MPRDGQTKRTDTPDAGVRRTLTGKQRYRQQLKLRDAMAQVIQLLAIFRQDDLDVNPQNLMLAANLADILIAAVAAVGGMGEIDATCFHPFAIDRAIAAKQKRVRETRKRRSRRTRSEQWSQVPGGAA
jgi:hypothetical protein